MTEQIHITDGSIEEIIPVRRRNTGGVQTVPVTITLPKELHQTINGLVVRTAKSRSLIISELIKKGLTK